MRNRFLCNYNSFGLLYFLLLLQKKVAKKSRADFDAVHFLSQPFPGQNRRWKTVLYRTRSLASHARRCELFMLYTRCRSGYQNQLSKMFRWRIPLIFLASGDGTQPVLLFFSKKKSKWWAFLSREKVVYESKTIYSFLFNLSTQFIIARNWW